MNDKDQLADSLFELRDSVTKLFDDPEFMAWYEQDAERAIRVYEIAGLIKRINSLEHSVSHGDGI